MTEVREAREKGKPVSDCCGAEVIEVWDSTSPTCGTVAWPSYYECKQCHRPCEVREKEGRK